MKEAIFKLENAGYTYPKGITGISDCNFEIKESDIIVVMGFNGCGKPTLLKILDGLYRPSQGKFYAFGEEVTENKLRDKKFNRFFRSNVGILFQDVEVQLLSYRL